MLVLLIVGENDDEVRFLPSTAEAQLTQENASKRVVRSVSVVFIFLRISSTNPDGHQRVDYWRSKKTVENQRQLASFLNHRGNNWRATPLVYHVCKVFP